MPSARDADGGDAQTEDAAADAGRRGVFDAKFAILTTLALWTSVFAVAWLIVAIF